MVGTKKTPSRKPKNGEERETPTQAVGGGDREKKKIWCQGKQMVEETRKQRKLELGSEKI